VLVVGALDPAFGPLHLTDTGQVSDDFDRELERARAHQREVGWGAGAQSSAAAGRVLAAERALASARGWPYAMAIDLGVVWDTGAPLPHVVSNGSKATLVCHSADTPPGWDGTWVQSVAASDTKQSEFLVIDFERCASIRFGSPNDEALRGHPLMGRGLQYYQVHEVINSEWLEEHIRINAVHPQHNETRLRELRHYFLTFHDDIFEALCRRVVARPVSGTLGSLLATASADLIDR
jgi:hypothetical protein